MKVRVLALGAAIAASAAVGRSHAQTDRPIFLTIVGHGAIRFRLARGWVAPCDSADNHMLFDGWLEPGEYTFATGSDVVCYQYTSGAFRNANWSTSQVAATTAGTKTRRWPLSLQVSTD
jgi:hypothetical protein